jgi:hypothetical protein
VFVCFFYLLECLFVSFTCLSVCLFEHLLECLNVCLFEYLRVWLTFLFVPLFKCLNDVSTVAVIRPLKFDEIVGAGNREPGSSSTSSTLRLLV